MTGFSGTEWAHGRGQAATGPGCGPLPGSSRWLHCAAVGVPERLVLPAACPRACVPVCLYFVCACAPVCVHAFKGADAVVVMTFAGVVTGCTGMAKLLLGRGADCSQGTTTTGFTPLMAAAQHSHAPIVALLLGSGACTQNVQRNDGRTAYDFAVASGAFGPDVLERLRPGPAERHTKTVL